MIASQTPGNFIILGPTESNLLIPMYSVLNLYHTIYGNYIVYKRNQAWFIDKMGFLCIISNFF